MGLSILVLVTAAGSPGGDLRGRLERLRAQEPSAEALVELRGLYADALDSGRRGSQLLGEVLLELDRFKELAPDFARLPDPRVKRSAAWALGVTASPRAADALQHLLEDEQVSVRRAAVDALEQLATHKAIAVLRLAVKDKSQAVRLASLRKLKAVDPDWIAQEIAEFLGDPSGKVVGEALRFAAENWRECSQAPGLVEAAASALGELPEAEEVLVRAGKEGSKAAVRALTKGSAEAAEAAARVLARAGADGATEELARAVREAEWPLARAAAEALGKLGSKDALMELARDGEESAENAILGLGHAKRSDELVDFLRSFLGRGGNLSRAAARSLAGLDGRKALPDLARMAESDDLADAMAAVRAMVAMKDRSKVGVLLSRLPSGDEWTALRAAAALVKLGNICGIPTLIKALASEDRMVRAYASTALAGAADSGIEFPLDGPEARTKKLARMWRIWWETHKRTLELPGEPVPSMPGEE